jgi:hypothetical protein
LAVLTSFRSAAFAALVCVCVAASLASSDVVLRFTYPAFQADSSGFGAPSAVPESSLVQVAVLGSSRTRPWFHVRTKSCVGMEGQPDSVALPLDLGGETWLFSVSVRDNWSNWSWPVYLQLNLPPVGVGDPPHPKPDPPPARQRCYDVQGRAVDCANVRSGVQFRRGQIPLSIVR